MAQKLSITIDADKVRNLIETRTYKDKDGNDVSIREIKFDLVEMKEESRKVLHDGDKLKMVKTHFAVKPQSKEERDSNQEVVYVGDGVTYVFKNAQQPTTAKFEQVQNLVQVEDDLPF